MEETKRCADCGKELPLSQFSKTKSGGTMSMCKECQGSRLRKGRNARKQQQMGEGSRYSDPEFDGKTPREVQDVLARAARWLNHYDGFTCEVKLRYEKAINLAIR